MRGFALVLLAGCTPAQVATGKTVTEVMAVAGTAGLVGTSVLAWESRADVRPAYLASAAVSAIGIIGYAVIELELEHERGRAPETPRQMHTRWARILTERAAGAARGGNCARVRRLEQRVRVYDTEVHDFVLMRDPEIVRCLETPADVP